MILMRQRRTKEGHNSVAQNMIHRAFVPMHFFHHVLDHSLKKFARFFGITVGEQLHRAFHIGKQHRDLLALAFERALGDENLFSEMLRSVDLRRYKARLRNCSTGYRMRALGAELRSCGKLIAAVRAGAGQRRRAFFTELRLRPVLKLALRTLHAAASSAGSVKLKVEPWPGALESVIRPPCSSTSKRVITSPSPVPRLDWGERSWTRKNLVKICVCSSGERPMPVSLTSTRTNPLSRRAATVMMPSTSVYLWALEMRFVRICVTPSASAHTAGSASPRSSPEPLPLGFDQRAQRAGDLRDQTGEVQARAVKIDLARLHAREIEEIVDQP